jgi:magnesium-transporting ATPase (P-type)
MTVVECWLGGAHFTLDSSVSGDKRPTITAAGALPPAVRDLLKEQLALNSTASIVAKVEKGVTKQEVKGSKTEGAGLKLVAAMVPAGVAGVPAYQAIRDAYAAEFRVIKQFAFSSERKMMSTIVELVRCRGGGGVLF